jgi:hypothetical protein
MNLRSTVDRLLEIIGDDSLFGGETMESLAKAHAFAHGQERLRRAPANVQRLAAFSALRLRWIKLTKDRYAAERSTILEKLDLQPYATNDEARDRIIEIGREIELNAAELAMLERCVSRPRHKAENTIASD